jgi:hypothetical protein
LSIQIDREELEIMLNRNKNCDNGISLLNNQKIPSIIVKILQLELFLATINHTA